MDNESISSSELVKSNEEEQNLNIKNYITTLEQFLRCHVNSEDFITKLKSIERCLSNAYPSTVNSEHGVIDVVTDVTVNEANRNPHEMYPTILKVLLFLLCDESRLEEAKGYFKKLSSSSLCLTSEEEIDSLTINKIIQTLLPRISLLRKTTAEISEDHYNAMEKIMGIEGWEMFSEIKSYVSSFLCVLLFPEIPEIPGNEESDEDIISKKILIASLIRDITETILLELDDLRSKNEIENTQKIPDFDSLYNFFQSADLISLSISSSMDLTTLASKLNGIPRSYFAEVEKKTEKIKREKKDLIININYHSLEYKENIPEDTTKIKEEFIPKTACQGMEQDKEKYHNKRAHKSRKERKGRKGRK